MKLTFLGAARQVTGSMYLLETEDNYKILIDCGLDLEKKKEEDGKTKKAETEKIFPFEPGELNLVLLTHAHIDHSGMIPNLFRLGYEGQVLCTPSTFHLARILLYDSASINQKKLKAAESNRKKGIKVADPRNKAEMYLHRHVDAAVDRFVTIAEGKKFKVTDDISVQFILAGHILGACSIIIRVKENGLEKSICFSGDVGRKGYLLLQDPQPVPQTDYMVCESTYGNRRHTKTDTPANSLYQVIKETCVDKPGRLIIPAFSVGRTQSLLYTMNRLYEERDLPRIKVFTDSPLALKSSQIYEQFIGQLNKEARAFYGDNGNLFDFNNLVYVESNKESKALSSYTEPSVIISSSGMVSGGRIEHHVRQNLQNSLATILIIGYCAEGTLGHALASGAKEIFFQGKILEVRCRVQILDCFSAHGDMDDLCAFLQSQHPAQTKSVFLTHGEAGIMDDFRQTVEGLGFRQVYTPAKGECFEL